MKNGTIPVRDRSDASTGDQRVEHAENKAEYIIGSRVIGPWWWRRRRYYVIGPYGEMCFHHHDDAVRALLMCRYYNAKSKS